MGANAKRDQPILLARLSPLVERLRVAQLRQRYGLGGGDFLRRQVADEHWLLAPAGLDRLPRRDLRNIDLGRGQRQDVGRRVHLVD